MFIQGAPTYSSVLRSATLGGTLALMVLGLTGCNDDTSNPASPPVQSNSAIATSSVTGTATVPVGSLKVITVTFTSSDSNPVDELQVTSGLSPLGAGWTGPASFRCPAVTTGNGCMLTLTYAPTAAASGSLSLSYTYQTAAGTQTIGQIGIPYVATTNDTVLATAAPAGTINAVVGAGSQAVAVNFTTSDGKTAKALSITGGLSTLPSGWSSSDHSFSCASVSTGSGCLLPLTFAPTTASSGTLTLNYGYTDNAGAAKTGTLSIPYVSTTHDNVVATAAPSGQVAVVVGAGSQAVAVTFTTDDGNAAHGLTIAATGTGGLGTLPAGWTSTAHTLTCASVSTGNGCLLPLTFAPTVASNGTLTLDYAYTDDAGTAKTGSLSIPYVSTTHDNVVATAAPSGQITAVTGAGSQSVALTFTTDDGNTAHGLTIAATGTGSLGALPAGWTSTAHSLTCTTVSTGNGCQVPLTYAPTATSSGTLTLNYSYTDDAGTPKTGVASIPYAATTNDNVVGTPSPSGQVTVFAGAGSQAVSVTFTTDDGRSATGLTLTTAPSSLPAGWTGPNAFTCNTVSTGSGCVLNLTFAPSAAATGTLTLGYSYSNNAGMPKTGTVQVPYVATAQDNVIATVSPTGQITAEIGGSSQAVTVTFTTDDGGTASSFNLTTALNSLPAGWSSTASSLSCSSVSTGTSCQLPLAYAPTGNGSGTLTLDYGYDDNAGVAKTGTVDIAYEATSPHLYVANLFSNLTVCSFGVNGALSGCAPTASGGSASPAGIAFYGDVAYVSDFYNGKVDVCTANSDGSISGCSAVSGFGYPWALAVSGNYLYVTTDNTNDHTMVCQIGAGGSISFANCANTGVNFSNGIAINGSYAYVDNFSGVQVCAINGDGTFSNCTSTGSGWSNPQFITISGGYVYVGNQNNTTVNVCSIGSAGALTNCATSSLGGYEPNGVALYGNYAYVGENSDNIYLCSVSGGGASLTGCAVSNGGGSYNAPQQLAVH